MITGPEPRRSICRASSGPVMPMPIVKAPVTTPALPNEPVSPWMKRISPTAPMPIGMRAEQGGEEQRLDPGRGEDAAVGGEALGRLLKGRCGHPTSVA